MDHHQVKLVKPSSIKTTVLTMYVPSYTRKTGVAIVVAYVIKAKWGGTRVNYVVKTELPGARKKTLIVTYSTCMLGSDCRTISTISVWHWW